MERKTKILLDADVVIHFANAERFSTLLDIFPEYKCVILDVVHSELYYRTSIYRMVENFASKFPQKLSIEKFNPQGLSQKEYFNLSRSLGKGESACMVYCRDHNDVLGSSNLRDIRTFCKNNNIAYLTTIDFLYYAYIRGKMIALDCTEFIETVIAKGSILPKTDIENYKCDVQL